MRARTPPGVRGGFVARFIDELKRTHHAAELRNTDEGKEVVLFGWVPSYRDHGGCVFIDLRDREGLTQLVFDPEHDRAAHAVAGPLRNEWCVGIAGEVRSRGTKVNDKMPTGAIEVWVKAIEVFSRADTPPFA